MKWLQRNHHDLDEDEDGAQEVEDYFEGGFRLENLDPAVHLVEKLLYFILFLYFLNICKFLCVDVVFEEDAGIVAEVEVGLFFLGVIPVLIGIPAGVEKFVADLVHPRRFL